ncbi:MAG: hypothetical protein PHU25_09095 [Deltaproteobacteria bacterium]|nr:hypothetical protein [Deltaproteobacteria bacterium]
MKRIALLAILLLAGCGAQKPEVAELTVDGGLVTANPGPAPATMAPGEQGGAGEAAKPVTPPKEETAPPKEEPSAPKAEKAKFPTPPANTGSRNPQKYVVSINKVMVLPIKDDGSCWDECSANANQAAAGVASQVGGGGATEFELAAKGLEIALKALKSTESLPDVFAHIDCGNGQRILAPANAGWNRLVAKWDNAKKEMSLDVNDQCAISVWDQDDAGDEKIGQIILAPLKRLAAGQDRITILGTKEDFGQVFLAEIGLRSLQPASGTGGAGGTGTGGAGGVSGGAKPGVPQALYSVEVVKAKIRDKKKDGSSWDAFVGKPADPFVEVYVNGYVSPKPFATTPVVKDNQQPVWSYKGSEVLKDTDRLHFMVFDKDAASDDLVGECKTEPIAKQKLAADGTLVLKDCGQVESLEVRIVKSGQ